MPGIPLKRRLSQFAFKRVGNFQQALQKGGVKRSAAALENHLQRFAVGVRFFITAFTGQSVIDVGQSDHLGGNGDFISLQAVRVTVAVVSFVVPAADIGSYFDKRRLLLVKRQFRQHFCADQRMPLYDFELLGSKASGLVQYVP